MDNQPPNPSGRLAEQIKSQLSTNLTPLDDTDYSAVVKNPPSGDQNNLTLKESSNSEKTELNKVYMFFSSFNLILKNKFKLLL